MNVLIDTNIVLDILLKREPYYRDAARVSVLSEKGHIQSYISASAVTDIFYIVRKEVLNSIIALNLIIDILKTIHIASVTEDYIYEALDMRWNDFEDSVQYVVGKSISADFIITRNVADYANGQIRAITPNEFISLITSH